jgi:hypothetical protein
VADRERRRCNPEDFEGLTELLDVIAVSPVCTSAGDAAETAGES